MRHRIAEDAKPQLLLLLLATAITVALYFIPLADYLVYPIRLFVTFIHESEDLRPATEQSFRTLFDPAIRLQRPGPKHRIQKCCSCRYGDR